MTTISGLMNFPNSRREPALSVVEGPHALPLTESGGLHVSF